MRHARVVAVLTAAAVTLAGLTACTGSTSTTPVKTSLALMVNVPDVVGFTRSAARKVLQNRGFAAVDGSVAPTGTDPKVTAQDPAAGSKTEGGATVSLTFENVSAAASTPPASNESALVQQVKAKYPGYPLVVGIGSVDSRVRNWATLGGSAVTQLVAVAPGVYEVYDPAVTDVNFYVDNGEVIGDCVVIAATFPNRGSTCWGGVLPGEEEPK